MRDPPHKECLLMERKEWNLKSEKLRTAVQDAKENWRKDFAAHLQGLLEAKKLEESLNKALDIEKQCVSDLEKALKDMRTNSTLKVSAYSRIVEAKDIFAGTEWKALLTESKLHAADALQEKVWVWLRRSCKKPKPMRTLKEGSACP